MMKFHQAVPAQTIVVRFAYISNGFIAHDNPVALAIGDITSLAFEYRPTGRTILFFMLATFFHIWIDE